MTVTVKNSDQPYRPKGKSKIDCWQHYGPDRSQMKIGGKGTKRQRQFFPIRDQKSKSAKKSRSRENPYQVMGDAKNQYKTGITRIQNLMDETQNQDQDV